MIKMSLSMTVSSICTSDVLPCSEREGFLMLHVTTKYECQVLIVCLAAKRLKKVRGFLAATQTPLQSLKASDLASALFGSSYACSRD